MACKKEPVAGEVTSFDMICMIKLKFKPLQVEFVHKKNAPTSLVAVSRPLVSGMMLHEPGSLHQFKHRPVTPLTLLRLEVRIGVRKGSKLSTVARVGVWPQRQFISLASYCPTVSQFSA